MICATCPAPFAPFGLGPPLLPETRHYCGVCIQFQPATQAALAMRAREAVDDREISVR